MMMSSTFSYGLAESPFGRFYVVCTPRGIRELQFYAADEGAVEQLMVAEYGRKGLLRRDDGMAVALAHDIFRHGNLVQRLDLEGTTFQQRVWAALLEVPFGTTIAYEELARRMGMPRAVRAVASAVARNRVAVLVPCHRIVHKDGSVGRYRWGSKLKQELIKWERYELSARG